MMQESVIYQEILEKGRQEEARRIVLRQSFHRFDALPDTLRSQIDVLSIEQLEILAEALLDFTQLADLETWFENQQK